MVNTIKFSHNWNNKLENSIFTTIRSQSSDKEEYYKGLIGDEFEVLLNGKLYCKAVLQCVEGALLGEFTNGLLMSDTGMPIIDAMELFAKFGLSPSDPALLLTFERSAILKKEE